ncbi:MAG: hypothetical protein AAFN81_06135 [Bacteroidota bacterium]
MKFLAVTFVCMLLLLGCESQENLPPAPPLDTRFQTTDPSRLYFNNIRSSNYNTQDFPQRYSKSYTLNNWPDTASTPFLVPTIIDYWLYDQAYLELNWQSLPANISLELPWTLVCTSETKTDTVLMEGKRWDQQFEFAAAIHAAILEPKQELALLLSDSIRVPVMQDSEVRRLFRLTWRDHQALADKNK